jgi:uncharacterized protein
MASTDSQRSRRYRHDPRPADGGPKKGRVVYSFGALADSLVDPVFKSSVPIAVLALGGAVLALVNAQTGWVVLACAVFVFAAMGVYARFVQPFRIRITRLAVTQVLRAAPAGGRVLKVCFVSDLHLGQFKRADWARRVTSLINAQQPDLILFGGDFAGRTECCTLESLFAPLAELRATYGAYAVLGNHDYGIPGPDHSPELLTLLPGLGVRMLRNSSVQVCPGLTLIGLDELWGPGVDYTRASARNDADSAAGDADDAVTLVLGHNPDAMDVIDVSEVRNPDRTVFLFGHTHHGQIRVPFLPGAAIPIEGKLYRGVHRLPQGGVYVSSGLGENTTPTRLGTSPEIVMLEVPVR